MKKKLEIGGGKKPREGYLQMDMKKLKGVDVVGDAKKLPFEDGELSEIYGHWLLEHFAYREIPKLLKEWHRALEKGGKVHMVTNNGEAHTFAYLEGVIDIHEYNRMLFGIALQKIDPKNVTDETPDHHTKYKMEDLHKIYWTKELVTHFFNPIFERVETDEQWRHREPDGTFKCPAIVIKAWK
ncbi:MAG: methyltransferase domain-containing protein [Alphaproteobacteria bacterium]|nr:methyltransferase domain-containing protein [Alphaproteobacteria bacterium]